MVMFQDMSYLCCIEIEGSEEDIVTAMKRLMSEDTGKVFTSNYSILFCFGCGKIRYQILFYLDETIITVTRLHEATLHKMVV